MIHKPNSKYVLKPILSPVPRLIKKNTIPIKPKKKANTLINEFLNLMTKRLEAINSNNPETVVPELINQATLDIALSCIVTK